MMKNLFTEQDFSRLCKLVYETLPELDLELKQIFQHINAPDMEGMVLRLCEIPTKFPNVPRWLRNWLLGVIPKLQTLCDDHYLDKSNSEQWWGGPCLGSAGRRRFADASQYDFTAVCLSICCAYVSCLTFAQGGGETQSWLDTGPIEEGRWRSLVPRRSDRISGH